MTELEIPDDPDEVNRLLEEIPDSPAVFLLFPQSGKPHLARTNVLRRRLRRALSGMKGTITRVAFRLTGSRLEAQFLVWELARQYLGAGYRDEIRLRMPPWIKLVLTNPFPRTVVTRHLAAAPAVYFGPFRNRSTAARFESEFLDLFQLRRCQEDLAPAPEHPGCIYGEMGRCLRPCQQAVGIAEYKSEVERVAEFLRTGGRSLAAPAESARDRLSAEMDFEGAAMMHQRCQRIGEVLGLRDEMVAELSRLNAIVVAPSVGKSAVELGWLRGGYWRGFSRIEFALEIGREGGKPFSLDARLRELVSQVSDKPVTGESSANPTERMEQLAILARWRYSSWCDGEMLMVDDWSKIPYRRLVNAVARIAHAGSA
jgi:excinuclease ABC subunit C